jgi:preprotein translocase SecE subunit
VARNRKRAKERRSRRPARAPGSRQGVATARPEREDGAPPPIEHAAPDVELADAQLALGRDELSAEPEPELEAPALVEADADEGAGFAAAVEEEEAAEEESVAVPAVRPRPGNRLVTFLQGSWRELQRVQWPDRRQVLQATGVVIGFVIVAGVFLGVADTLAAKLMNFILK